MATLGFNTPAFAQPATGQAPAQPQPGVRTTVYDAAFFAQDAPATALDIVRRVPGFSIEQSNGDVRGFAGAAGNVVFNGARPSSKSDSLETILARIPASRVLRVEIGAGDLFGSDFSGKSQVLNVILSVEGGVSGNATIKLQRLFDGTAVPNAEASVLIKRGVSTINVAAATGRNDSIEEGFDRLTNLVTPASGPLRDDRLIEHFRTPSYELGADIARPLAGGAIKFVALANRRDRDTFDTNLNRVNGATIGGFEQLVSARYDEALGRLSWSRRALGVRTARP